jgi:hypothetical protein
MQRSNQMQLLILMLFDHYLLRLIVLAEIDFIWLCIIITILFMVSLTALYMIDCID